jgi:hypothetical protein
MYRRYPLLTRLLLGLALLVVAPFLIALLWLAVPFLVALIVALAVSQAGVARDGLPAIYNRYP